MWPWLGVLGKRCVRVDLPCFNRLIHLLSTCDVVERVLDGPVDPLIEIICLRGIGFGAGVIHVFHGHINWMRMERDLAVLVRSAVFQNMQRLGLYAAKNGMTR